MPLTRAGAGVTLRLLGPAIQVVCLIGLFWPAPEVPSRGFTTLRHACLIGFGVGLLLAGVGLALSMSARLAARTGVKGDRGPLEL